MNRTRRHAQAKRILAASVANPFVWALALRVWLFFQFPHTTAGDALDYEILASNLAAGHGFSRCQIPPYPATAQRPPLISLLLAPLYGLGMQHDHAAFLLNVLFDAAAMLLIRAWGRELKLAWADRLPWVIALCPMLVAYSPYPTLENVGMALFFGASLLTFQQARRGPGAWRTAALAGLHWGVLALARSYYLLFPIALLILPPSRAWSRRRLVIVAIMSFAVPSVWMARNSRDIGRLSFTQTSSVGFQMYPGLCIANFDWWRPEHARRITTHPVLARFIGSHCMPEEEIARIDREARELALDCVEERPLETARNVALKTAMLFVNWGQLLPYIRMSDSVRDPVNAFMVFYWWCVACLLIRHRRRIQGSLREGLRFGAVGAAYVVAVTLPFALDARYLLGPFLVILVVALELAGGPAKLAAAGLFLDRRKGR